MSTCILLSTCDKYISLAACTIDLINQRWENHPPIYVCGASDPCIENVKFLMLEDDPLDWIGITQSAVAHLISLKYDKCYLILDDHPPLGQCNENHLNITLPTLMAKLNAAYIGLYGWDQGTSSLGDAHAAEYQYLQKQAGSFSWRYSLHPALWDLEFLNSILVMMPVLNNDMFTRSIWSFERRSGSFAYPLQYAPSNGDSYRVFGLGMLAGSNKLLRKFFRQGFYAFGNLLLWIVGTVLGKSIKTRLEQSMMPERLFFDGPYPLYWSGVMQKGRINKNLEKYLIFHHRENELRIIRKALNPK